MADVILNFSNIYIGFRDDAGDNATFLVNCIEKRWRDCEQPLFVLALFLHPQYRDFFNRLNEVAGMTTISGIAEITIFYYQRFISTDIVGIRQEVMGWHSTDSFYNNIKPSEFQGPSAAIDFWKFIVTATKGNARLGKLALIILSVVINTATCERLFSELALILTAKRNRLDPAKATKMSVVRAAVRKKNNATKANVSAYPLMVAKGPLIKHIVDAIERNRIDVEDSATDSSISDEDEESQESENERAVDPIENDLEAASGDQIFAEWQQILAQVNEGDDNNDEGKEVEELESGQVRAPFPNYNDKHFPQEPRPSALTGVRGRKVLLADLMGNRGITTADQWRFD